MFAAVAPYDQSGQDTLRKYSPMRITRGTSERMKIKTPWSENIHSLNLFKQSSFIVCYPTVFRRAANLLLPDHQAQLNYKSVQIFQEQT